MTEETPNPPQPSQRQPLQEGVDYTIENGQWVFTAAYLLRRGHCCDSGCRNCPYKGPGRDANNPTSS